MIIKTMYVEAIVSLNIFFAKLYSRIIPLYSFVVEGDGVPTQGMREVYATLKGELDVLEKEWTALLGAEIATLNKAAQSAIVIP